MRLDRLLTLGLFHPLQRLGMGSRIPRLPILMYHSVSDGAEQNVAPYFQVRTSPARFAEHMQWLAELGYRAVTLGEGLAWLDRQSNASDPKSIATQPVAVTFDDGFQDFHTEAYLVLQRYGFAATMYLPTAFIADKRKCFKGHPCMTWAEIRDLAAAGIEFGSHTVNHPRLVDATWREIEIELSESKSAIEQQLGQPVHSFAYPYAFPQENRNFASRFRMVLETAGYANCVTTSIGRPDGSVDRLHLPRLPVNTADDRNLLTAKLNGAYDWLAVPQITGKFLRHMLGHQRPVLNT